MKKELEEELIDKIINGDKEAFTKMYQNMSEVLFNVAKFKLGDNIDDINDVIQETMIMSYTNIHKLKNKNSFRSWIIKILINECNKFFVKNKKDLCLCEKLKFNFKDSKDKDFETINEKLVLTKAVKCLSDQERLILQLYYNNHPIKEIAKELRIKENTIKSKIRRGKSKIQKYMGGKYE